PLRCATARRPATGKRLPSHRDRGRIAFQLSPRFLTAISPRFLMARLRRIQGVPTEQGEPARPGSPQLDRRNLLGGLTSAPWPVRLFPHRFHPTHSCVAALFSP